MSALVRLLYPLPTRSRSPAAIIGWWERRRLAFNLMVGAAGLLSIGVMNLILALPPLSRGPGIPFLPAVVFGVLANLCYSAGWGAEIAFNAWWREDPPAVGPVLFRQGLIFSIGLTLLPVVLASLEWAARLVRWVLSL